MCESIIIASSNPLTMRGAQGFRDNFKPQIINFNYKVIFLSKRAVNCSLLRIKILIFGLMKVSEEKTATKIEINLSARINHSLVARKRKHSSLTYEKFYITWIGQMYFESASVFFFFCLKGRQSDVSQLARDVSLFRSAGFLVLNSR